MNNRLQSVQFAGVGVFSNFTDKTVHDQEPLTPIGIVHLNNRTHWETVCFCATAGCRNLINYNNAKLRRFSSWRSNHCQQCRTYKGVVFVEEKLWDERAFVASRHTFASGQTVLLMKCTRPGCNTSVKRQEWRQHHYMCREHRRHARFLHGHKIRSLKVWRMRAQVLSISKNKTGRLLYSYQCGNQLCKATVKITSEGFHKRSKKSCSQCLASVKRAPLNVLAYRTMKRRAASAKIACSLTQQQFHKLCTVTRCFYCNASVKRRTRAQLQKSKAANPYFLDRIDNEKGYHYDNLVICCIQCNKIKNAWKTAQHMMALRSFSGWESELLLLVRKMKPDRVRRLAAKHRRSGG